MARYETKHGTLTACKDGIVFNTGHETLAFHRGIPVPVYLVELPPEKINPRELICIKNVDVRRVFVQKVGIDRIITAFNAQLVDRDGDYELVLLEIGDNRRRPYLRMRNPSLPGVWHVEGVHPNVRTVKEALAWRNGRDGKPVQLT